MHSVSKFSQNYFPARSLGKAKYFKTSGLHRNARLPFKSDAILCVVNETTNSTGQAVRRLQDASGGIVEVTLDTAGKIVSSRIAALSCRESVQSQLEKISECCADVSRL